jgi:hypothetical protein
MSFFFFKSVTVFDIMTHVFMKEVELFRIVCISVFFYWRWIFINYLSLMIANTFIEVVFKGVIRV